MHAKTILQVSVLGFTVLLSGCGLFGSSNPAEGKWKVTSENVGGFGSSFATQEANNQVYTFTADHLRSPTAEEKIKKYVVHGHHISVYLEGPNGSTGIIHLKMQDHNKKMAMDAGMVTIEMTKISN